MCGKHVGPGYKVECITMEHEAFVTVTSVDGRLAKWAFRKHRGLFMMVEPDMVQRVIHGIITMDLSGPRVRGSCARTEGPSRSGPDAARGRRAAGVRWLACTRTGRVGPVRLAYG
jgi:hypothetical protein